MVHDRWSRVAAPVDAFLMKRPVANLLDGHSRASDAAREAVGVARLSIPEQADGSVAR